LIESADTDTDVYTANQPDQYCGRGGQVNMLINVDNAYVPGLGLSNHSVLSLAQY